jgi:hypothetical protein
VSRVALLAALDEIEAEAEARSYGDPGYSGGAWFVAERVRAILATWPAGHVYRHERPEIGDWIEVELTGEVNANGWPRARMIGTGALDGARNPDHRGEIEQTISVDPAALGTSWVRVRP